jgi:hypothetical protein
LAVFPKAESRDLEFYVQASILQDTTTSTEIRALIENRSAWPARASSALSFRYFVNLSETYGAGYSASDIQVVSNYSQGATIGPLTAWDSAARVYYVDVSFSGVRIAPGAGSFEKEAQLKIGLKPGVPSSAWDPTNDWSYQGLISGRDNLRATANIPVYEFGTSKLYGDAPGATVPGTPSIVIGSASISEGNSGTKSMTFTVTLSAAATKKVTVNYSTFDGTAAAGSDYDANSGVITFAAGTTTQTITIVIRGDTLSEPNETFFVRLSSPTNAVLATTQATGTILDDDGPKASYRIDYAVTDKWGTGFVASVTITNTGTTAITDWVAEFDLASEIVNIWNGSIQSRVGNRYRVAAMDYNRVINPGQSVTFGFQASGSAPAALSYSKLYGTGL